MKKNKNGCDLKSCFLCSKALPEWIPAIAGHKKNFHYKKGELIFKEGDEVKGVHFVYSGKVKVHKKWGTEKELIIRFARSGDIFGHRGLGHDKHYPVSATALEPVEVCFIDLAFFQASLKVNFEFTYRLLLFFADELQESERKMRNLAHMQVKGRIAQALILLKNKFGQNGDGFLDIVLSRQDLASFAGTTYETVFRIINEFIQDKVILTADKNIAILDMDKLLNYTRETDNE